MYVLLQYFIYIYISNLSSVLYGTYPCMTCSVLVCIVPQPFMDRASTIEAIMHAIRTIT